MADVKNSGVVTFGGPRGGGMSDASVNAVLDRTPFLHLGPRSMTVQEWSDRYLRPAVLEARHG